MPLTWTREEIRDKFRELTGRKTTDQISDSDVNDLINDYYVNHFPGDAKVDEFDTFFTQALSATDDGIYALDSTVDRFDDPVTINGRQIEFSRQREEFFGTDHDRHHHHFNFFGVRTTFLQHQFIDEQFITAPTLVIGSSDNTKVKHSDFTYKVQDFSYSKASSEVALTGSAIPQGKFGAWSLKIDTDGDIAVAAAVANSTGYDTPRIALEALNSSDSTTAYMGYVTVTKSDGAFTPAATALDASNVTATFTDGKFENRGEPIRALLYGTNLYVDPKPNDIYEFKALQIADRPTAFASDSDKPADPKHGPAIALGTAMIFLSDNGDTEKLAEQSPRSRTLKNSIRSDKVKRLLGTVIVRSS
jgi:hypothetical protein